MIRPLPAGDVRKKHDGATIAAVGPHGDCSGP